jgi:ParB family chromosome partitioning protein
MNNKKIGLGRGLGALLPGSDTPTNSGLAEVPVRAILPNPHQPRGFFDEQALKELADSIREHGLIQPLIVVRSGEDQYTLIAGERRWRAAQIAGLEVVPVVVKDAAPQQMLEMALVENVQRADLNPLEEASAYQQLMRDFKLTQEKVAGRVGKSREAVTNTLRLLGLPDQLKEALLQENISEGHARALLGLPSPEMQIAGLKEVTKRDLSVRETEEWVRRVNAAAQMTREAEDAEAPKKDPHMAALEDDFRRSLGTKVELFRSSRGGRVVIYFYSDEELEGIYGTIVRS